MGRKKKAASTLSETGVQVIEEDLFPDTGLKTVDRNVSIEERAANLRANMPHYAETNPDPDSIYEIPLDQIRPAPWNPPARIQPDVVRELADSMALHGQQIPALVRPVNGAGEPRNGVQYEIVFGHRRYAALQLRREEYHPSDPQRTIVMLRTFIRPMDEEDAMILSGIENLQRQGFSDIEEAEFFRAAGDRYGESAVKMLAEKLSVSERYIRKRITILELPDQALELWRSGTWHVGHMEQLLRVGDQCQAAGTPYFFKGWGEYHTHSILASTGEPHFRMFQSKQHWIDKARTWVHSKSACIDTAGKLLRCGADFDLAEYPVAIMDRVGKRAAGSLLDGRTHEEFPNAIH